MDEITCPVCWRAYPEREDGSGECPCGLHAVFPHGRYDWEGERVGTYEHRPTKGSDQRLIAEETKRFSEAVEEARRVYALRQA